MAEIVESEYKGNPMLVIKNNSDEKFPLQFGLRKARLILAHLEEIRAFVHKYPEKT